MLKNLLDVHVGMIKHFSSLREKYVISEHEGMSWQIWVEDDRYSSYEHMGNYSHSSLLVLKNCFSLQAGMPVHLVCFSLK